MQEGLKVTAKKKLRVGKWLPQKLEPREGMFGITENQPGLALNAYNKDGSLKRMREISLPDIGGKKDALLVKYHLNKLKNAEDLPTANKHITSLFDFVNSTPSLRDKVIAGIEEHGASHKDEKIAKLSRRILDRINMNKNK